MIKEVTGDILLTKAQAIAHGVAPMDHFDRGLALSLRKDYPSMAKDFRHYCKLQNPAPGEVWMWGGVGNVRILNLITQEPAKGHNGHPGSATTKCQSCIKKFCKSDKRGKNRKSCSTEISYRLRKVRLGRSTAFN
jgi:O-acetyl-ADP-ribose deacetylase (regulator of RNase III)